MHIARSSDSSDSSAECVAFVIVVVNAFRRRYLNTNPKCLFPSWSVKPNVKKDVEDDDDDRVASSSSVFDAPSSGKQKFPLHATSTNRRPRPSSSSSFPPPKSYNASFDDEDIIVGKKSAASGAFFPRFFWMKNAVAREEDDDDVDVDTSRGPPIAKAFSPRASSKADRREGEREALLCGNKNNQLKSLSLSFFFLLTTILGF
tara:strand:+ start:2645 stop:3253 length:609 start_codon:yes stop_codon:yes gene_type:complete